METFLPLTEQQKNIWDSEAFYSGSSVNNICGYIFIEEVVDFNLFNKAVNLYVKHTDSMNYRLALKGNEVYQYEAPFEKFTMECIDVKDIEEATKLSMSLLNEPFDVLNSKLFRFYTFRLPDGKGGLIGIFHHIICDAWTMSLLISRVMEIYSKLLKGVSNFEDYPKYADYVLSSSDYLKSAKYQKDKEFWENSFSKEPSLTYIYKNQKQSSLPIYDCEGARETYKIDSNLSEQIATFCKDNHASPYNFFMAIYLLYLSKINNTNYALLGTPVLNRANFNEKQISGMFVSTVPFGMSIDSNLEFTQFLKQVVTNQMSVFRHQKYPYMKLLEQIKEKYDINENLYDFVLSYQNAKDNKNLSDVLYSSQWVSNEKVSNPIEVHFYDMDDSGSLSIFYNYQTNKFSQAEIQNLHQRIMSMAEFALKNTVIKDIPVITKAEEKLINEFNNTDYKYNKDLSIVELFSRQVKKNKNKTAVIFKGKKLSYEELDKQSNKVANMLLSQDITQNDVIGVMLNRSFNIHIALWGILKTGASYMLIDPNLPKDRISYMLKNANAKLVITDLDLDYEKIDISKRSKFSSSSPKTMPSKKIGFLSKFSNEDKNIQSNENRFCVIYTSGSTGVPKGVELKRLSIINLVNSFTQILHTNNCEMFLSTSTVAFDMFMVENFVSILSGKTVVLADEEEQKIPALTSKLITKYNIDFIVSTPSKISLLLDTPDCLKNLKVIQLGGEVLKPSLFRKLKEATNADIHNGYGPSECTACSSNKLVTDENDITIGKPYLNVKMYIMNNDNNILPIGIPGELVIKGDGVGLGYINKMQFDRIYRTGDIAKLSPDLDLIYYGRQDNQIKLHGLRIELDEITEKLVSLRYIDNAISVIKKVNNIDCICSFVTLTDKKEKNYNERIAQIKKSLAIKLPNYMVPSHIIILESFPITLNGKINAKLLPEIEITQTDFVKSSSETEKALEKIWCNILGLNKISTNANFFELGGDSLASIRLVSDIITKLNTKIEIKDIFEYPTISELAKYIDSTKETATSETIKHTEISPGKLYPVTSSQRGIYYNVSMIENSTSYNTPFGILFDKMPNIKKLEKALNTIINSNSSFRTSFVLENNGVYAKIEDHIDFKLEVKNYKNDDFVKPFDLGVAPLAHIELDQYDGKALLQIDIHHIICDGASIGIFAKELCDLYEGLEVPKKKLDYYDYALNEKINPKSKEYWCSQFSQNIPLLNMPTEYDRTNTLSEEGESIFDRLDNVEAIDSFCKKQNVTPYMFLLACYYCLLYKYTMQTDIVVGSPVIGRDNHNFDRVIGMFVNTLALRQSIQPANSFADLVNQVKQNCLNAFARQDYPFEELIKNIDIPRDNSRRPLFDVLFIYESGGLPKLNLKGLKTEYIIPDNHTSKFDFSLEITPSEESYNLRLEFATKLFSAKFMKTFLEGFKNIVNSVINNPDIRISQIQILSNAPVLYPKFEFDKNLRIIDLFEKQVKETPDKIALIFENEQYTYKQLETKVNKLANYIKNLPVYKNEISKDKYKIIGIMMNRRAELIISILATLKAGAAYLPIDPMYPDERIEYIIEDSHIKLLLTETKLKNKFGIKAVNVDDEAIYKEYKEFDTPSTADDVAYLIYTSGSTGKPKGVLIKQLGVVNFILSTLARMPLKDKTIVNITTACFDIFVFETLLPLSCGMKIVLANNDEQNNPILLNKLCLKNGVQVLQTTPSKFKFLMTDNLEYLKKLEVISLIGESFPLDLFKRIKSVTKARVYNMYGPTETTVGSTLKELTSTKEKVTIGTPFGNTLIYVLDNDLNPVPYNVPGKLFIGGAGITIGYLNKPEITAQRYIDYNSERIYDTGDLVKLLPNGELECLGRTDFQVKVRGLRIELLEIENAIRAYHDIQETVVTVKSINGRDILCGYFTSEQKISVSLLKNSLAKKLPNYMVPTYLIQIKSFAYTPNGKIDRKLLPEPVIEEKEIINPKTPLEKRILKIWKSILSLEKISIDDNFFNIGGDSLCALKLQLELMKIGYNINYGDIFKNNTISSLASFIESQSTSNETNTTYKMKHFNNIHKLLRQNSYYKKLSLRERELKNVLLFGATGFLGIHLLAELLKIDDIKIYCIIRENPSTSSENKLKNKFKFYFGTDLSNLFGTRIFVLNGDVSFDKFGLSDEQYKLLGGSINHVINSAALVKHYGDYSDFEKVNVTGVKNIISFCEEFRKEFFQISTISVSGNTMTSLASSYNPNKKVYFGEKNLYIKQSLENVYVRSKFEAEKLILNEIANFRLKGMVLRVGNITNRYSDGKFQENSDDNAFLNRLKAFMALGIVPDSMMQNYAEFTPVDKLAEAIVTSMKYYTRPYSVLHLYNSKHLYINDLYNILSKLNISVKIVDEETFKKKLKKWLYDNSKSDKVSVFLNDLDNNNKLVYKTNLITTNKFTLRFLELADFSWPEIDINYIRKVLNNMG